MKLPKVPWKNMAAIGGAVRIKVVRINPMPPCCIAWLVMPSLDAPMSGNLFTSAVIQNEADTRITMSSAIETIAASTAMENMVPIP